MERALQKIIIVFFKKKLNKGSAVTTERNSGQKESNKNPLVKSKK